MIDLTQKDSCWTPNCLICFPKVPRTCIFMSAILPPAVPRWSAGAVAEFELQDEYMEASDWMWLCRIHPEDQEKFVRDLEHMMSGKNGDVHHCEYRIRNRAGQYVWIRSRGVLRRDQNGVPTFFAAVLRNMGLNPKYGHHHQPVYRTRVPRASV